MRLIVIFLSLYATGVITCLAQSSLSKNRFGLTGGLNASQIQQSTTPSHLLWRYNAGVTFERSFSSDLGLSYGLIYSRQGNTNKVTGSVGDDKIITSVDYLNLPIMLRVRPKTERVFIEIGGQIGYLLSGDSYFASSKNQSSDLRHTHHFDVGPTGGVGYRLGTHFVVDLRYYYGTQPILANYTASDPLTGVSTYYNVVKWYNRVYFLNLSYYL